jgi:hypothetical protein
LRELALEFVVVQVQNLQVGQKAKVWGGSAYRVLLKLDLGHRTAGLLEVIRKPTVDALTLGGLGSVGTEIYLLKRVDLEERGTVFRQPGHVPLQALPRTVDIDEITKSIALEPIPVTVAGTLLRTTRPSNFASCMPAVALR